MKITFACTTSELEKYGDNYKHIVDTIKNLGHTITRDWLDTALKNKKSKEKAPVSWKNIFHEVSESIMACDAAIFECTVSSFSNGYQMSIALEKNKPVLVLGREDGKRDLRDSFISGVDSDLITVKTYNSNNIEKILEEFFIRNEGRSEKSRFNFYIDRNIENYLDWASYNYKKTKSDLLRDMIYSKIDDDNDDNRYKRYITDEK